MIPCDYHQLPHKGIRSLSPYVPGKSSATVAKEQGLTDIIKLASNENPLGCSPHVMTALSSLTLQKIATYPIARQHPLHQKLADSLQIDAEQLTLSNGSDALFTLLQTCFALHSDKHILTHQYAFMAYAIQAKALGVPVVTTPVHTDWRVDIDALIAACNEKTALIFLANPNNPTGLLISEQEIERLLDNTPPSTLVVIDEAYYEYVAPHRRPNTLALLTRYPHLVITRTFSKAYGLAGLRLGFAISNATIADILQRVILPFTVNEAVLTAGFVAYDDHDFIKKTIDNNVNGRQQLQEGLTQLGLNHLPTDANFITFDCQKDAIRIDQALQQKGIIIRPLHPYQLPHHLRVTIGTNLQNKRFLNCLKELYHGQ